MARSFGASRAPDRAGRRATSQGAHRRARRRRRVEAVGDPQALELAIRLAASAASSSVVGVYAERCEVHMGLLWIKALRMETGHANVIGHLDTVLALMASGDLDPTPLVTHHMKLDEAPRPTALRPPRGPQDRPGA
jgi:threonine dehydrogenase-like Zn-dependent dehydrogenase